MGLLIHKMLSPRFSLAPVIRPACRRPSPCSTRSFLRNTGIRWFWIRVLRSMIEPDPAKAVEDLEPARPTEYNFLSPIYERRLAYLRLGRGPEAPPELQKLLAHRTIAPLSVVHPLSQLALARACVLHDDT